MAISSHAVCCLLLFLGISHLPAQDWLRGWGTRQFDTGLHSVPATSIVAEHSLTAVARTDGRIVMVGTGQHSDGPTAPPGISYVQLSLGTGSHGYALRSDGTIVVWGTGALAPPALPTGTTYVQVSAGTNHAVARRSDGTAVAWGANNHGQTSLPLPPAGVTVLHAVAGHLFSIQLWSNGTIVGNGFGSLGVAPPLPPGIGYTNLWVGRYRAIAARSDGAFVSWGDNSHGEGNVPALPTGVTYTTMALGGSHTVALRSDGAVTAWGDNYYGQCNVPALPGSAAIAQLACGSSHTMLRFADGKLLSFGEDMYAAPMPPLPPGVRWAAAACGIWSLGLTSTGEIIEVESGVSPAPNPPLGLVYVAISTHSGHSVALRSDGRAIAWGDNTHGQLAIPPLPPGSTYTQVSTGFGRTVLLRSDGFAVHCGNGGSQVPLPAPIFGTYYEEVSTHSQGTMLRRSDGVILVVGNQSIGVVQFPPPPPGLRYVACAKMRTFNAALRSDGNVVTGSPTITMPPLPAGVVYVQIDSGEDQLALRRSDGHIVGVATTSYDPFLVTPQPGPGESFVEVSAGYTGGTVRVGPTRTYVSYGSGCAGTLPASRLVPRDTPCIGRTFELTVFDLPQPLAILMFGWSRIPPVSLAGLGMPTCSLHVTIDATIALSVQNGQAKHFLSVPDDPSLVGARFTHQAIVFDAAANTAGLVVSDAAEGVIGRP